MEPKRVIGLGLRMVSALVNGFIHGLHYIDMNTTQVNKSDAYKCIKVIIVRLSSWLGIAVGGTDIMHYQKSLYRER